MGLQTLHNFRLDNFILSIKITKTHQAVVGYSRKILDSPTPTNTYGASKKEWASSHCLYILVSSSQQKEKEDQYKLLSWVQSTYHCVAWINWQWQQVMHSFVHREDNIWEELHWQPAIPITKQIPEPGNPIHHAVQEPFPIWQTHNHWRETPGRWAPLLLFSHYAGCQAYQHESKHSQYINSEGQKRFESSTYGAAATRRDRARSAAARMPPCFSFDTMCSRPA